MNKYVAIDTNLFLDDANILFKLASIYDKILIPLTVIKELDVKKFQPDFSYSARSAIRAIIDFKSKYPNRIEFSNESTELSINDLKILEAAKKVDADIATKDMSMSIMAEAKGLKTLLYDVVMNGLFKPYIHINKKSLHNSFKYFNKIEGLAYADFIDMINENSEDKLNTDAWMFILIEDENIEGPVVYAHNPIDKTIQRIDNDKNYVEVCVDGNYLKSRDPYQNCAMYALKEAPHALITGSWGTGKTLIATACTLENATRKTFITRPPIGISNKYDLGFMPGSKEEKMLDWCGGFLSALYYMYHNTKNQKFNKDNMEMIYDFVRDDLFQRKFEIIPINMIQGLSLLNEDTLIADEVQLLDINYMSMLMSRPSETGKLIMLGDLAQTYNIVKPSESGLLKLLRILPHKSLAYVELKVNYRSELLEIATKLQDRTIV